MTDSESTSSNARALVGRITRILSEPSDAAQSASTSTSRDQRDAERPELGESWPECTSFARLTLTRTQTLTRTLT